MNQKDPSVITARLVLERARMNFLPKHFGKQAIFVENMVLATMRRICANCPGAPWNFYDLSNGGGYMAPQINGELQICIVGNYYEGKMSADAAGIVATALALNALMCRVEEDWTIIKHENLMDFARDHQESLSIRKALD